MAVTLKDLLALSGGRLQVPGEAADVATNNPPVTSAHAEGGATSRIRENAEALEVSEIGLDTKTLPQGALFAALPGTRAHGATFANTCEAGAILTDEEGWELLRKADEKRSVIVVDDVRQVLGPISAEIYGHPSEKLTIIGVTGTSGKTTTTYMVERGLMAAGLAVGLIGTTGTRIKGTAVPTSLTTPEAPTLHKLFKRMIDEGVTHVVMEVSSHALMLGRVAGTCFTVAGFSNLSQDHLDFHPTMEDYFEAKALFFDPSSPQRAQNAVVCTDDEWGQRMAQRAGSDAFTVATHGQSGTLTAHDVATDPTGAQHFVARIAKDSRVAGSPLDIDVDVPIPGRFNVANAALALGCIAAAGVDVAACAAGIRDVDVPGRMEAINEGQDFMAVVDYAHKPGAIAEVLDTVRAQIDGRIAAVIGAGGDRDASKRPIMGAEAVKRADYVVITDDNPRSEDPAAIRAEIVRGAQEQAERNEEAQCAARDDSGDMRQSTVTIEEIGDRRSAITAAIEWAQSGDAVVVCGKGHEQGQLIKGVTHPFDDRDEVRRALKVRLASLSE